MTLRGIAAIALPLLMIGHGFRIARSPDVAVAHAAMMGRVRGASRRQVHGLCREMRPPYRPGRREAVAEQGQGEQ